jgi:hypothetical protein
MILSVALVATAGFVSAQTNGKIEAAAKKAAKDAGCVGDYKGALETSTNFLGACSSDIATTSAWTEVYVLPKVNPNDAPLVRIAPFAKVTFCGDEILSVECTFE